MTDEAFEILSYLKKYGYKCLEKDCEDLVFASSVHKAIIGDNVNVCLYNACDKAGIERVHVHTLRHTFATRAIENGMTPKVLQRILGHKSITTTMDLYCHVTEDSLFSEMEKMNKSLTTKNNQKK